MATGLRFKWGSYTSPIGTARPVSMSITPADVNSFQPRLVYELQCEIWLQAEGPANITTAIEALKNALLIPRQDGGIQYTTDGSTWLNTSHFVNASGAGVGPVAKSFSAPAGPLQYAAEQWVQVTISAEYNNTSESVELMKWEESVEIIGEGGARTVLRPRHNSVSLLQEIRPYTDVTVTQSGLLIARSTFSPLPAALISTSGARQVEVTRDGKSKVMRGGSTYEYHRRYSFSFHLNAHPGTINPGGL